MEFVARIAEASGIVAERTFAADNEAELRVELARRGLHVFRVRAKGTTFGFRLGRRVRRVGDQDFLTFNQELVALLKAGLPLLQCLQLLGERRKDLVLRGILADVHGKVKGGSSLSDAFAAQGEALPGVYAPSVMAGEKSGNLESVLRRYVAYAQILGGVKRKVTSALVYPIALVVLAFGLVGILVTYVIPKFASFYTDFDAPLPWITRLLLATSTLAQDNVVWIVTSVVLAPVALRLAVMDPRALRLRDRLVLSLPAVGEVLRKYNVSQFSRTLSTLLGGGLPLMPSLEIASRAVGNAFIGARLAQVAVGVKEGAALTECLHETGLWSDTTLQMVRVGESAGALVEMLGNAADFYDAEVERQVQTFVTLLEPALLVVMGGVVAGMLLAMYYPLFNLIQVVH